MLARTSFAFRSGLWLAAMAVLASGCARPTAPLPNYDYSTSNGDVPVGGFIRMPVVIADEQPTKVIGLDSNARQSYNDEQEKARQAQVDAAHTGKNSFGAQVVQCVVGTLVVFSPFCVVLVPAVYGAIGANASLNHPAAPELPSDNDIARLGEHMNERSVAMGVARQITNVANYGGRVGADSLYPILVIKAESLTFNPGINRIVVVEVIAQGLPSSEVAWAPTRHRYHFTYPHDDEHFSRRLLDAETAIARDICYMYGLKGLSSAGCGMISQQEWATATKPVIREERPVDESKLYGSCKASPDCGDSLRCINGSCIR